ncbi:glycoside hydrolase family 26 protein [Oerskovia enterophila]|uniref:Endoglucanase H n=1 Tax=Oerskovia enterophila TaxID=43678 RepID=A0A163SKK1_9CELL|nr:glycosyl hydrolase [Oerskovia enterophila]KZM36519.1 endoglucanase H precursor [Oerskovia enterophila]
MTFYLPGTGGRRRRPGLVTPVMIMFLGVGAVGAGFAVAGPAEDAAPPAPETCTADAAQVVPADGTLLGVNLDWASETLEEHRTYLGHAPAVAVQFSDVPYDRATWEHTVSAVTQMKANGGVLLLTLEPHAGLAAMSDEVIATLAHDLREVNQQGVAVVLRFAHEMNGSWYAWGQQPTAYVETFRRVAAAVHDQAPGTAMMWAPNYGGGYPFTGGQFAALPGSADYAALDTDGDGTVTMADDSYLPYFPGDDAVDWVGVSLYHWGNQRPWGNNEVPEDGKFLAMLTGTYVGTAGDDAAVPDFYTVYGVEHGHPVAVPETAAIYTPSRGGAAELDIKRAWWRQVFSPETHERFPQLKMVNWFEWDKYEIEIDDDVDWRAAGATDVRDAFVADLPSWLRYAEDVSTCEE